MPRRRFTDREKAALWVAEQGVCAWCGDVLAGTWHGDHRTAFVHGGVTDVTNGQGLCARCNLRKGDGFVDTGGWPVDLVLREWQREMFSAVLAHGAADFLCVATPGAGKTTSALRVAHQFISEGIVERLVVVVPTDHLREQWKDAAARVGIQLQRDWRNRSGQETADFDGVVVTYQAVASAPLVYRTQCSRARTLVILDEIHHAGDSLSWGQNIRQAFEPAARRLLLSGTPFRSDGRTIPFVRYDGNICAADFTYGYGKALTDAVCRPVMFPRFDGEMRWWSDSGMVTATFRDELPQEEASRRLRTALDTKGDWLADVLRDADRELTEIRDETHPEAAGLVVCMDQPHAKDIAALVKSVTGTEPTIAISEDTQASTKIKRFAASSDRWIVAVKMISEGVDIPRLRVGVYATNVISNLFFRQVVGRFVRKQIDIDEQVAYLFIPDDDMLRLYAERIKDERDAALEEIERRPYDEGDEEREVRTPSSSTFVPGSSGPADFVGVTTDGAVFPRAELDRAAEIARHYGRTAREDAVFVAKILRDMGGSAAGAASEPTASSRSANDRRRDLRDIRKTKTRKFAPLFRRVTGLAERDAAQLFNGRMAKRCGSRVEHATIEQLERGNRLFDAWQRAIEEAFRLGTVDDWFESWQRGDFDGAENNAAAGA